MKMYRLLAALALPLVCLPAQAQTTNPWPRFIPVRPDGTVIDPGSVGGGGGGGTVSQGTSPWVISGNSTANGSTNPIFVQLTSGSVSASQSGAWTVALSAGTSAIGSVLADLRVNGAAVASGNPVPVTVGNFPATQAVSSPGTFAVQNTAPVIGGNSAAVKTDSSATTQPISAATLPLPTGAATAANQNSTAAGTSATSAQGVQGVSGGVPLPIQGGNATAVKTDSSATTQPVSAATLPLPAGAATAANQSTQITAEQTVATASPRSIVYPEVTAGTAIAANATFNGVVRANQTACASWVAVAQTDVASTLYIGVSDNGFTTRGFNMASVAMAAGTMTSVKVPAAFGWYKLQITAGATAGNVNVASFACVAN